jgi:hypothetical protein
MIEHSILKPKKRKLDEAIDKTPKNVLQVIVDVLNSMHSF